MAPKKQKKPQPKNKVDQIQNNDDQKLDSVVAVAVTEEVTVRSTRSRKQAKVELKVEVSIKKVEPEPVVKKTRKGQMIDEKKIDPIVDTPIASTDKKDKKKLKTKGQDILPQSDSKKVKTTPDSPKPVQKSGLDEEKELVKLTTTLVKGGAAVDEFVDDKKKYHVLVEQGMMYDCTMNQTNIMNSNNNNKFYVVQVLETDALPRKYYCFNRWGRVGSTGQYGLKGPWSKESCIADYCSKVRDKSLKGEYRIIEKDYTPQVDPKISEKRQDDAFDKSKLHSKVKELVHLIFDLKMINQSMMEIGYDASKMPLGKLAKSTIEKGFKVLEQISQAIKKNSSLAEFQSLTSEFFSQIPHNFGFNKAPVIQTVADVKKKLEMLESIQQIQVATKILEEDGKAKEHENILDNHYDKLDCKIGWIAPESEKYKMLESYVKNTHAKTHDTYSLDVLEIFELDKELDKTRFKKDIGNRRLLWHGSRITNFVGILSQGLRIAPPEAPVTGYMFGKGVYFADMVSKSANYCGASRINDVGMLLLCDVALGDMNDKYQADYNASDLPAGKQSTRGVGQTAPPEKSYVDDDGCLVPLGVGEPTKIARSALLYNEYIVYDIAQIQFKYLIKLKYNYK